MASETRLLIIGASVRAAAFSALRAGLRPWCADLFADADLQAGCHTVRIASADYPHGFTSLLAKAASGPWMYTGGLENYPELIQEIAARRELWGNGAESLRKARSPKFIHSLLRDAGLLSPICHEHFADVPEHGRWLVKPLAGSGGAGIAHFSESAEKRKRVYFQQFIDGVPHSAVFLSIKGEVLLLGVTEQLTGVNWLHAPEFHYCGSIGPLGLSPGFGRLLEKVGQVLSAGCNLSGLFGVDYIYRNGDIFPLEINPRYTASVEILEHVFQFAALSIHRRSFDQFGPAASLPKYDFDKVVGKAIIFAREALTFPPDGPWNDALRHKRSVKELPTFADIPHTGEPIQKGRPILTIFAQADSEDECRERLQHVAADLDRRLFGT